MTHILITATDEGNLLAVHTDFNDTATYLEMLQQASDVLHVKAHDFTVSSWTFNAGAYKAEMIHRSSLE